jgi:glycerophosphoryl diester phosphodiesterase
VSGFNSLSSAGAYTAVSKSLLLDLSTLNIPLDNIEGITFGPTLPNGQQSIVLVSDNNFNSTQFTQFIAFGANVIPAPGTIAVLAVAGVFAGRRRR